MTTLMPPPMTGLSTAEAQRRLRTVGPNTVASIRSRPVWRMVADQLADTMIIVLLVAAVLTALIGDLTDMAVILVVIVVNGAIGVSQEMRATRAMTALARLSAPQARVLRDGVLCTVPAEHVVPGDVVILEAGDIVPADADLVDAQGVQVDEAMLTGESVPVDKSTATVTPDTEAPTLPSRMYAGTVVTRGRATAVVTATGMRTTLGGIAGALQEANPPRTPLQRRLARLGRQLSVMAVALCLVVLALGVLRGQPLELMLVTAISLAVAAIPESLPAVVTVSLALGAQRMAARNAVIRHLPAVETLGSVTMIATDKTGTVTEGRMSPAWVWTPTGGVDVSSDTSPETTEALLDIAEAVVLCNDAAGHSKGDPTELALVELSRRLGVDGDAVRERLPRIAEAPFDSLRARMTTVHRQPDGQLLVVCKGAPEALLPRVAADSSVLNRATRRAAELATAGYRVLAVALGTRTDQQLPGDPDELGRGLPLLGLVALEDPPRARTPEAVAACRTAGIRPVMITGDHPATASAIARRVGILDGKARVLTGRQLNGTPHDHLTDVGVFARTLPEQKLGLVRQWQAAGQVVAMTGDGVNDAPALRTADIGVAMGRGGTEVAKDAADMVLADDDFATIVSAVHEGRRIYANIRRFVTYGLAGGTAEILLMLIGPFVGLALPLLPAQILWINLLTHGLPGVAFGLEPAEPDAMRRAPRPPEENVLGGGLWRRVLLLGALIAGTTLALGVWAYQTGRPWQTMVFATLALMQLSSAFALRSDTVPAWRTRLRDNPMLPAALLINVTLLLGAVYWPPAHAVFSTEPLRLSDLGIVLLVSLVSLVGVEAAKARRRRAARSADPLLPPSGRTRACSPREGHR